MTRKGPPLIAEWPAFRGCHKRRSWGASACGADQISINELHPDQDCRHGRPEFTFHHSFHIGRGKPAGAKQCKHTSWYNLIMMYLSSSHISTTTNGSERVVISLVNNRGISTCVAESIYRTQRKTSVGDSNWFHTRLWHAICSLSSTISRLVFSTAIFTTIDICCR